MNAVEEALGRLHEVLATVQLDGKPLRVGRLGHQLDPPAAVVAPPKLLRAAMGPDPTEAQFVVAVVVAKDGREMTSLLRWEQAVVEALHELPDAVVGSTSDPGSWPSGGVELPAYLIPVEYGL